MKTCFKCKQQKPYSDFYRHPEMGDGYLGKCKECTKKDVSARRSENIDYVRAYDRERGYLPERKKLVKQRYKERTSTAEGRKKEWARAKKWILANPEKSKAHTAVNNAVRDGKLKREPCKDCGTKKWVQAHHEDYSKPLEITWLCRRCHGLRHRELNEESRA